MKNQITLNLRRCYPDYRPSFGSYIIFGYQCVVFLDCQLEKHSFKVYLYLHGLGRLMIQIKFKFFPYLWSQNILSLLRKWIIFLRVISARIIMCVFLDELSLYLQSFSRITENILMFLHVLRAKSDIFAHKSMN